MSCDRSCFRFGDEWFGHEGCSTCPGQDSGPGRNGENGWEKYCHACGTTHPTREWPHKPEPTIEALMERYGWLAEEMQELKAKNCALTSERDALAAEAALRGE